MRIIVDIDDVTGAVTITPETQDPDVGAAEERRMTEVRSGICAPAPRSPLSPDTDLPVPDHRVMAFMAGVPWWSMSETSEPDAVEAEPDAAECVADGLTHEFRDSAGRLYRWHDAGRQLNIYGDNGLGLRTIKGIDVNAVTTGPDRFGILYRVGLPAEVGRPTCFVGYDDAVAFAEWLESVGGPKRQREPEPALDTFTFDAPKRAAGRDGIKRALDSAHMPERLTGCRVVVDWTGAEAVTASAVHETILWLYNRNAAAVEFVTDNKDVVDAIGRVLGWEDVATLLPITLVDNSEPEPEPEPERSVPHNATIGDTTYEWQPAVSELVIDHDDGKGWTIEGVRPDLYVWNVGCVHGKRTGECGSSLIDPSGVHVPTYRGLVFVPVARVNGASVLASWLAEVFEKGKV